MHLDIDCFIAPPNRAAALTDTILVLASSRNNRFCPLDTLWTDGWHGFNRGACRLAPSCTCNLALALPRRSAEVRYHIASVVQLSLGCARSLRRIATYIVQRVVSVYAKRQICTCVQREVYMGVRLFDALFARNIERPRLWPCILTAAPVQPS